MNWCDKLASTPAIGLKLDHRFAPTAELLEILEPILNPLVHHDKPQFNINRLEAYNLEFTTEDGFHYGFDSSRISVEFHHRLRARPVSGGRPVAELISRAEPYTQLLPEVSERLVSATRQVLELGKRQLIRVGVITTTVVAEEDVPPGVARLIQYIGRPWRGNVDNFSFQITGELERNDKWTDRCVHLLVKPEDPEQLPTVRFDWYRTFAAPRQATLPIIEEELKRAIEASSKYFEELAEGNRFDEELISSPE